MDRSPEREFIRYRQVVAVAFVTAVGLAVAYLIVSIAVGLARHHRVRHGRPPIGGRPTSAEMLNCHREVERLFVDLTAGYATVQADLSKSPMKISLRGREIQRQWRHAWREVGQHCRFAELAGSDVAPGFDELARSHARLEELEFGFRALLSRFGRQLAPAVNEVRQSLAQSRRELEAHASQARPTSRKQGD